MTKEIRLIVGDKRNHLIGLFESFLAASSGQNSHIYNLIDILEEGEGGEHVFVVGRINCGGFYTLIGFLR